MRGVTLDFSRPGKPTDNSFIEPFDDKFRAECLNANWFPSLYEARQKYEAWRRDHNEVRPHSSIGNKTPRASSAAGQPRPARRWMRPEISGQAGPTSGVSSLVSQTLILPRRKIGGQVAISWRPDEAAP
jgi:putative transposase